MDIINSIKGLFIQKFQKEDPFKNQITTKPEYDIFVMPPGIRQPDIAPSLPLLQYIHNSSPAIKIATLRLRESIFRRGFDWESKFESKCPVCGKEFEKKTPICEECKARTVEPDNSEIKRAEKFFKKVNVNNQQLLHILKQAEDDINVFDDAYIIGIKEYIQTAEGDITFSSLKEIVRGNPITMRLVANEKGELGGKYYICLHHRDVIEEDKDKKCRKCGRKLFDVHYVSVEGGGESPKAFYIEDEVIHFSKYAPSALYGFSPIVTLWEHALTLNHMMKYVYQSYTVQHLPKGVLAIKTSNPDSAFKFWRDTDDKLQKDPHYIPKMFIEGDGDGVGMEFVRFMDTLEEMQYIPVRDEIRRTIAAIYGITGIFLNDMQGVGGLNAESEQIEITNMAAESAMIVYNDVVFPELCGWLNIKDWDYKLNSPFEENKMKELDEKLKDTQIAQSMLQMGFQVKRDEEGEFIYSGEAINPQQQMFGGLGQQNMGNLPPELPPPQVDEQQKEDDGKEVAGIYVKSDEIMKFDGERGINREKRDLQRTLNKIFEQEIAKVYSHTGKFSSIEMKKFTKRVVDEAVKKMKLATDDHLVDIYKEGQNYVGQLVGKAVDFTDVDKMALKAITDHKVLWDAYSGMGKSLSGKLNKVITDSYKKPKEFSISAMVEKMKQEADVETYKFERIVRTETQAAAMKGREIGFRKFDPENTYLYKWAVKHDARTSEICKEIEKKIDDEGGAVPLDRLNSILKEISLKYHGNNWQYRDFVPHPNCRSGLSRVVMTKSQELVEKQIKLIDKITEGMDEKREEE